MELENKFGIFIVVIYVSIKKDCDLQMYTI